METINDVVHTLNKLYFKAFLVVEGYHTFESFRKKLNNEFFQDNVHKEDLVNLLNMADDVHIRFLSEQKPDSEETINSFRQFVFKLIEQKIVVN